MEGLDQRCVAVSTELNHTRIDFHRFSLTDPQLNGTFQINKGLRLARGLLLEIVRTTARDRFLSES